MKFDKDIYISYAHLDNEPENEDLKGWVTEFHQSLEVRLKQIIGQNLVIFRDSKLQGNGDFSHEMEEQFSQFKIMVCIITTRYLNSAWCLRELDLFYKSAALTGGIAVDNKARIFKVNKTPVDLEDQPEKIRPFLGYDFFSIDEQSGRVIEFGRFKKDIDYWDRLDGIAHDIADLIRKINTN